MLCVGIARSGPYLILDEEQSLACYRARKAPQRTQKVEGLIHLSDTANPSDHVRNRAKRMWTRTVSMDTYIVKPKEKGKARRVVKLLQSSAGIRIECTDKVTGETCPANSLETYSCRHR